MFGLYPSATRSFFFNLNVPEIIIKSFLYENDLILKYLNNKTIMKYIIFIKIKVKKVLNIFITIMKI